MEKVKSMDKYTVLAELRKMVKHPLKVTDLSINRDIFEIPEEKINKTSLLYPLKDGKKTVYVPVLQEEKEIEPPVNLKTAKRLLLKSNYKDIVKDYLEQEKEKPEPKLNQNNILQLIDTYIKKKPEKEPKKEKKEEKEEKKEMRMDIVPYKQEQEQESESKSELESESEEKFIPSVIGKLKKMDISKAAQLHKGILKHMKQELGHKIIEEQVLLLKEENPEINTKDINSIKKEVMKEVNKEDVKPEDVKKLVEKVVEQEVIKKKLTKQESAAKAREALAKKREAEKKSKEEAENLKKKQKI
jgi:hypothetical protein